MEIIDKIKKNKYENLPDSLIKKELDLFSKKYPKLKEKDLIKKVREKLHRIYGAFQLKKSKREKLLELKKFKEILKTNISTKERLPYYKELYKEIFKITGNPKKILDLGCGINPISFEFMNLKKTEFYCVDIDKKDLLFLEEYFKLRKLKYKTKVLDLNEEIFNFPKTDICFMFKVLDVLKKKNRYELLEKLLKINTKYFVFSFSTKTLTGKKMNLSRRFWIEKVLKKLNLEFNKVFIENELFYIVK